jgi:hypothetical protein
MGDVPRFCGCYNVIIKVIRKWSMFYLRSFKLFFLISLASLGLSLTPVKASTVIGGTLLDQAGADDLESWLGAGDQTFINVFAGTAGATAASWHSAVDGSADTISIYEISYAGEQLLIGGYRSLVQTSNGGWQHDLEAFIFNLSSSRVMYGSDSHPSYPGFEVYDESSYFSTFGAGHDLYGGENTLGSTNGAYANGPWSYGYSSGENILGTTSSGSVERFTVSALETYTLAPSAVPVPAAVWLFGTALIGVFGFGRRGLVG